MAYVCLGCAASAAGFLAMAGSVATRTGYLVASLLITIGFMVQDVVADALSVEVAKTDEEIGQIQTLGRMATLGGGISVGFLSGWLAETIGTRVTFVAAALLPVLVGLMVPFARIGRCAALVTAPAAPGYGGRLW